MKWTKTSKKLPPSDTPVFVYDINWKYNPCINIAMRYFVPNEGWYWAINNGASNILDTDNYEDIDDYTFTHWAKMIKPLKEKPNE